VKAAGIAFGEGGDEGVAGAAPGPPDALDVVGLGGRHGGEHHGGEVTDVDTQLESGGGGEQVGGVGAAAVLEAGLDPFTLLASEEPCVLGGDDPADPPGAVQAAVVVGAHRRRLGIAPSAAQPQARSPDPLGQAIGCGVVAVGAQATAHLGGREPVGAGNDIYE